MRSFDQWVRPTSLAFPAYGITSFSPWAISSPPIQCYFLKSDQWFSLISCLFSNLSCNSMFLYFLLLYFLFNYIIAWNSQNSWEIIFQEGAFSTNNQPHLKHSDKSTVLVIMASHNEMEIEEQNTWSELDLELMATGSEFKKFYGQMDFNVRQPLAITKITVS